MVRSGRDLKDHLVPTPLPWAGTSSTRSGCSKLQLTDDTRFRSDPCIFGEKMEARQYSQMAIEKYILHTT